MKLQRLLEPKSIAVIGASRDTKKVGASILTNIREGKFRGRIYPVNPKAAKIQGLRCFDSVLAIPGIVDLAIIAVPAPLVADMLKMCGKKKIPFAIIITSGFGETGPVGKAQEQQLKEIARRYHITIVGPNCLGIIATGSQVNASFGGAMPAPGTISCISQSGALLVSLVDWAHEARIGMRTLVSIGNQVGLSEPQMLEHLAQDPHTSVIGMYVEEINDGPAFMAALARCSRKKPVVVLKAGFSEAGVRAVSSHTGSLAGSAEVVSAMLRQAGAIQATDVENFFKLIQLFSYGHQNPSRSVAIVTNAGGPGIIATDILSTTKLHLASLSEKTVRSLQKALPQGSAIANPVDLMGDADLDRFKKTLALLDADVDTGVIFCIVTPQRMTPVNDIARYLVSFQRRSKKQVVACFIGGSSLNQARKTLNQGGVIQFAYPNDALLALSLSKTHAPTARTSGHKQHKETVDSGDRALMLYATMQRLLVREKFPLAQGSIIQNAAQAKKLKGFPLALKVLSTRAIHKARAGALALDITSSRSAELVVRRFTREFQGKGFEGILVQKMLSGGREFIMGMKRDAVAGMVLLFGVGGSLAEELKDTVLHIGRLSSTSEAQKVLAQIRHQALLEGIDRNFLAQLLKKLSDFGMRHPEVYELDFNPVKVYRKGGTIIDARIFIKNKKH